MFTGLVGTLSAPLVLDENPNTYLVAAQTSDNKVTLYTLTNSGADPPTLSGPATIPVPPYTIPANAPQPGTINTLDTSDCRFVNAGTQIGNSLFQVHTIDSGGLAKCRFYEFDTVNKQVIQTGTFGRSDTSFDFNASIAANRRKDVFVTWSSTDVANNVNAEVRYSGRLHTEPVGVIASPGSLLYGSNTFYSANIGNLAQRWGDYSAVSLDPSDSSGLTAWIVNERILTNATWGSRIGRIGLPPCPQCSGDPVVLTNKTFESDAMCECAAATSITIGAGVTIKNGATVIFKAPKVYVKPGAHFAGGAYVVPRKTSSEYRNR